MAEFEEKLNAILGDQQAMGQIMALARSLSGGGEDNSAQPETLPEPDTGGGGGDMAALLGGMDPALVQMGMRLMQEYNRADDRNTALLAALRPFVRQERYARVDRAVQIARLSRVIRVLFEAMKERGDSSCV